ncbi:helix-turn-helix domain-containing protein [Rodentibacter pneumotropicus]|uniref:Helix-turn-helix domain-containing protein n=1 Tax=Rodentibacter pneumotropicus TaxID=758 RepID=A0AAW5LC19_9PAST|nr:helix-turn-helix domain-containing protein [Rodentibacter pneumotropicus]MCQ9121603.1 helix-turn-helix domain-containing protein [Rodentibacter pneumotropicus]
MENINPNEKSSQSQNNRILRYLQNGNRITSLDALMLFGCMRLSARIYDLKERGYPIEDEFVYDGLTGKSYKAYFMAVGA